MRESRRGSARASRAGDGVLAIANFFISANGRFDRSKDRGCSIIDFTGILVEHVMNRLSLTCWRTILGRSRGFVSALHCDWRFDRRMWLVPDEFEIFEFEVVDVFDGRIQFQPR